MFEKVYQETVLDIAEKMDQYIIDFFGSEEAAKKHLHLYVLETLPLKVKKPSDTMDGRFVYTIEQELRLRLKTPEELATEEEKHDELEGWTPTRWWQAWQTFPDEEETLLMETSSPDDFKTYGLYGNPDVMIIRLYSKTIDTEYMSVREDPFK